MPLRKAIKEMDIVIDALAEAFEVADNWHDGFDYTDREQLRFLINEFLADDRIRLEVVDPDIPTETKWVTGE